MARLLARRGLALPTNGKRKNPDATWRGEGDASDISGVVGMLYDTLNAKKRRVKWRPSELLKARDTERKSALAELLCLKVGVSHAERPFLAGLLVKLIAPASG